MPSQCRFKLPLVLALVGVGLLIGCVPIPIYRKRQHPEAHIGSASSSKPVGVGRSTRDDLRRLQPDPELSQGDALVYPYHVDTVWFFPCFGAHSQGRYLRVEFDEQGILRRYKVFASRADASRPLKK